MTTWVMLKRFTSGAERCMREKSGCRGQDGRMERSNQGQGPRSICGLVGCLRWCINGAAHRLSGRVGRNINGFESDRVGGRRVGGLSIGRGGYGLGIRGFLRASIEVIVHLGVEGCSELHATLFTLLFFELVFATLALGR